MNYQIVEDQKAYLRIQNSLGQTLQEFSVFANSREIVVDVKHLMNGTYNLHLVSDNKVLQQEKFVILR